MLYRCFIVISEKLELWYVYDGTKQIIFGMCTYVCYVSTNSPF